MEFVKECIEHFRAQKLLHRKFVCQLLLAARAMFAALPSLLRVPLPTLPTGGEGTVTVCGDTHGQYYDLLNIFEIGGFPSETNPYLFNGDFVDRGSFSFENVMTLILIKLACPAALHMTRGNHETKVSQSACAVLCCAVLCCAALRCSGLPGPTFHPHSLHPSPPLHPHPPPSTHAHPRT